MAAFAESTPCWVDVSLPDLEAGKRFYGELFGWTFGGSGDRESGQYTEAFSDGKRVAGLVAKKDGRMPTVWGIYFATADAVALCRRITEAGGRLVRDPVAIGRNGIVAQAADPDGAVFGVWQAGEDPGFEKKGLPGSFCWTECYTRDKERVDRFYETVFGFRGTDLPSPSVDFRMWSPAGTEPGEATAIGGRSVITDAFPVELPSHFLSYFSVFDCDATAALAVRLGGRVSAPPFDIPHGRMAVLLDNQGASFAVLSESAASAAASAAGPAASAASAASADAAESGPERGRKPA
ncbi:VOC family protein [Streptomyces paludis]|uniref:VOC family protein n=1 Tax=Streptomyces paludis TaxID=2282738 RepID=A0A345HS71_9ACTN|nr:VOC family protein [Streptomyces paludis]AXG79545.1 VOC family protein [Streptomyces paludis]